MTATIGAGVSLNGIYDEDAQFTYLLASATTIDDIGKAVTVDTSAANKVKLAVAGDRILGRLETFEDRTVEGIKVGAVSTGGILQFPIADSVTVNVGDLLVGGLDAATVGGCVKTMTLTHVAAATAAALTTAGGNTYADAATKVTIDAVALDIVTKVNAAIDALVAKAGVRWQAIEVQATYVVAQQI